MKKNIEIILTIGIPASGKSTWAKDFVKHKSLKHIRVCRDDIRMMVQQAQQLDSKGEMLVTEIVNKTIASAANARYNVILDATNLNQKYLNQTIEFCRKYGDVKFQVFHISLEEAKERDKNREASVGDVVLNRMYDQYSYLIDSGFDFDTIRPKYDRIEETKFISASNRKDCVVFDLDGTLAHNNGKRGYFDWTKVGVDDVDEVTKETLMAYKDRGYDIVVVSGRDGASFPATQKWLEDNDIPVDNIFLRTAGDFRKDTVVKTEIYEQHLKPMYNILCVLEDRQKVVDMWRGLGVKCFQVIDGDY